MVADAFAVVNPRADVIHIVRVVAPNSGRVQQSAPLHPETTGPGPAGSNGPGSFTVFGTAGGTIVRSRVSDGGPREYVLDALRHVVVGGDCPIGGVLDFPLPGLPCPQVVVSRTSLWDSSKTLVVDLRPVGSHVRCFVLPLHRPLQEICTGSAPLATFLRNEGLDFGLLRVFVNGVIYARHAQLDSSSQTITFRPRTDPASVTSSGPHGHPFAAGAGVSVSPTTVLGGVRPPTPPIPPDGTAPDRPSRWGSGTRWDHFAYAPLRPPAPTASTVPDKVVASDFGEEGLKFTVFDKYFHRREFDRSPTHDLLDLVELALAATPQIRRPWSHRIQRVTWPDFPEPQIVIWGSLPEGHRIVPIRDADAVPLV